MLKVGVLNIPPYSFIQNNKYNGIFIKIWEHIAKKNKFQFKYINAGTNVDKALNHIQDYDILLSGISVTYDRQQLVIFSRPVMLNHIAIAYKESNIFQKIISETDNIKHLISSTSITIIVLIMIGIIFSYIEYGSIKKIPNVLFTTSISFLGQGPPEVPNSIFGKLYIFFVMLTGLFLFGLVTATLTTYFIQNFVDKFSTTDDIKNKTFVVKDGTYAKLEIEKYGGITKISNDVFKDYNHKTDSGIARDFPTLYYDKPKNFIISSLVFGENELAIAINKKNLDIVQKINESIVEFRENGFSDNICKKFIGTKSHLCEL